MKNGIPIVSSVLHPTDFSEGSHRAFAYALAISVLRQTELTILHVGPEGESDIDWSRFPQVRDTLERWELLEAGSDRSAVQNQLGVEVRKLALESRNPIRAIVGYLENQPYDLVVLATEGLASRGADWRHDSEAEAISRKSRSMTLFVPGEAQRDFVSQTDGDLNLRNVVVPIDPAIDFTAAIEFARRAAEILGDGEVTVSLVHVGDEMPDLPALPEQSGCTWQPLLCEGDVVDSLLAAVDELKADLVVMTTNGRDTLGQALSGSTTERIVRKAPCAVLAVPDGQFDSSS